MDLFWKETYDDIKREFKDLCSLVQKKQLTKYKNSKALNVYNEEDVLVKIQKIARNIKKVLRSKDLDDKKRKLLSTLLTELKEKILGKGFMQFAWAYSKKDKL